MRCGYPRSKTNQSGYESKDRAANIKMLPNIKRFRLWGNRRRCSLHATCSSLPEGPRLMVDDHRRNLKRSSSCIDGQTSRTIHTIVTNAVINRGSVSHMRAFAKAIGWPIGLVYARRTTLVYSRRIYVTPLNRKAALSRMDDAHLQKETSQTKRSAVSWSALPERGSLCYAQIFWISSRQAGIRQIL